MNTIRLKGIIKDIEFSHKVGDIEYYKAFLAVTSEKMENVIPIKFKRFRNQYVEGDEVSLVGNVRTYSYKDEIGRRNILPYVFTYFDEPKQPENNMIELDGIIHSMKSPKQTSNGKDVMDLMIVNEIKTDDIILKTYLPIVAWGINVKKLKSKKVGDYIRFEGHFTSRTYKKRVGDTFEYKMSYEINMDRLLGDTNVNN